MIRMFLIITAFFMTASAAISEELTQTIRGTVIDKQTLAPLIGVTIVVMDTEPMKGAKTNELGEFKIKGIKLGRQNLRVSYIGYNTAFVTNIIVSSAKETVLEIKLEEKVSKTDEVLVTGNKKTATINRAAIVSARTFTVEETRRFAGAIQDPARLASNYAGVVTANDERNDIIIRGNSPSGLLWRLEGIDIPNPNHFSMAGTTGGGISILNNNNLSNSDFFTGAFPAEYGNATSGVFDLNLRNGNDEKREYMLQFGVMGLEAGAEGPLSKDSRSSYVANYRYSTLSVMDRLGAGFEDFPGVPVYQDLVFNIELPNSETFGKFTIFGMGGTSEMKFKFQDQDDDDFDTFDENELKNSADDHMMGVLGISNTLLLNNKSFLKTAIAFTGTDNNYTVDSILPDQSLKMIDEMKMRETEYHLSMQYNTKFDSRNSLSGGIYAKYGNFLYLDSTYNKGLSFFKVNNNYEGGKALLRAYANWRHKFSDDLLMNTGLNYQYFTFNKTYALEPRFGIKWNMAERQSLSFGAGLHSQLQPFVYYLFETESADGQKLRTNKNLDFTKSAHLVLGYDFNFSDDFRFKTEAYYQHLYDVPVESSASYWSMANFGADFKTPFMDSLVNEGVGNNYGIEFTLEKFFSNNYYFLVTASIYDSNYEGGDGIERNTVFNGNYSFTALAGYELNVSESSALFADLKCNFIGNKRKIPIDLDASNLIGEPVYDFDNAYKDRLKDYFRADIKLGYRFNTLNTSHYIVLELRNMFDTENVFSEMYDHKMKRVAELKQMTLMPNLYYKIEF